MFAQHSGAPKIEAYRKTASTVFEFGDLVTVTSGLLVRAVAGTARNAIVGIIQRTVTASDPDYASQTAVPVLVLDQNNNEFIADVQTGSAVQSMVGTLVDLADHDALNVSASVTKTFRITKIISTARVVGRFETSEI